MNQCKVDSWLESGTNILVGLVLSYLTYRYIAPLFQVHMSVVQSVHLTIVFTVISLTRQYVLRRIFNGRKVFIYLKEKYLSGC